MTAAAAAVSRALAAAGERPLASGTTRNREGIRVSRSASGYVYVVVDVDSARLAAERADSCEAILRAAGYDVERKAPNRLHVRRP